MLTSFKNRFEAGSSINRASNFEFLRLVAMYMIVQHHYAGDPSFQFDREAETYKWRNEYFIRSLETTGKMGVSLFLLMTGYFQGTKPIKMRSIARTWFKTLCWSYFIAIGFQLYNQQGFSEGYMVILMPVLNHNYWFVTTYIASACFSGFTATVCEYANPAKYVSGLVTYFVLMSLMPFDGFVAFCNTQWFMFVIALGAFLRRFQRYLKIRILYLLLALALSLAVVYGSIYIFLFYDVPWADRHGGPNTLVRENWCPLPLLIGCILILLTARSKPFVSPVINRAASLSLGVYLVHEHILMRSFIWKEIVRGVDYRDHYYLPVIALLQIITVYTLCSLAELIRQLILGSIEASVAESADNIGRRVGDFINDKLEVHEKV